MPFQDTMLELAHSDAMTGQITSPIFMADDILFVFCRS